MREAVRQRLRAALQARRNELGASAPHLGSTRAAPDLEASLRVLMTVLYPRFSDRRATETDATRAIDLLLPLGAAAGRSLRVIDAFNSYFELAIPGSILARQPLWSSVLAAYRAAIDRLYDEPTIEEETEGPSLPESAVDRQSQHRGTAPPRAVLVLADNARVGWRILSAVRKHDGIDARVLICRNGPVSVTRFCLRQARAFARALADGPLMLLGSLLEGRWRMTLRPLADPHVTAWIKGRHFDVGLHGMGVIYRRPTLEAFRIGVLNAHIGYLPPFRGRSVVEWSLLLGAPLGVTVFFMDEGIDTGSRLVLWQPLDGSPPRDLDTTRRLLFDSDGACYAAGLRAMREASFRFVHNDLMLGRRYYVMSRLFREVAEFALKERCREEQLQPETTIGAGEPVGPFVSFSPTAASIGSAQRKAGAE